MTNPVPVAIELRRRLPKAKHLSVAERLEHFSMPEPNSGCQLWIGGVTHNGYGQLMCEGVQSRAHRVAWELANGPVQEGKVVCHHCDVRSCINVQHLWVGTQAENLADRDAKNRQATGARNGASAAYRNSLLSGRVRSGPEERTI